LQRLHKAVKEAREEQKQEDKRIYDKSHNVREPKWAVNDRVWLQKADSIRPGSPKVLTHPRYTGPFIVKNIVKRDDNIGTAYQLINEKTGKPWRYLITHDRIKACDLDREAFSKRLPSLQEAREGTPNTQTEQPNASQSIKKPEPLYIVRTRISRGKKEYLVQTIKPTGVIGSAPL